MAAGQELRMSRPYNSPSSSQKARPFLVIRTCKHIKDNGALCQAVAQKGSAYCHHHLLLRQRRLKMARAGRAASCLKLPLLEDMKSIQVALARVQVALEAGHIEESRARLLRWGLRLAATNLRHIERMEQLQSGPAETTPALAQSRKSNNLYQMPITIINSRASKKNGS